MVEAVVTADGDVRLTHETMALGVKAGGKAAPWRQGRPPAERFALESLMDESGWCSLPLANACSGSAMLETFSDGQRWVRRFADGRPTGPTECSEASAPGYRTRIELAPDRSVLPEGEIPLGLERWSIHDLIPNSPVQRFEWPHQQAVVIQFRDERTDGHAVWKPLSLPRPSEVVGTVLFPVLFMRFVDLLAHDHRSHPEEWATRTARSMIDAAAAYIGDLDVPGDVVAAVRIQQAEDIASVTGLIQGLMHEVARIDPSIPDPLDLVRDRVGEAEEFRGWIHLASALVAEV